jgi:hypothetical protein
MKLNPDFKYLVIGAYAFSYYVEPRTTKDIDIWVEPTPENAHRLHQALQEFGAPLEGISEKDFCELELIYQIGVAPNRIDILMDLGSIPFKEAWKRKTTAKYGEEKVYFISREDLITVKKASGRPQDLNDVKDLEKSRSLLQSKKVK